jgi:hypothetical protein
VSLLLLAHDIEPLRTKRGARVDREALRRVDLHWHDLRHEAASRWLERGLDVRAIQLLLGHASITTTQRYLNVTDQEMLQAMQTKLWTGISNDPANMEQPTQENKKAGYTSRPSASRHPTRVGGCELARAPRWARPHKWKRPKGLSLRPLWLRGRLGNVPRLCSGWLRETGRSNPASATARRFCKRSANPVLS